MSDHGQLIDFYRNYGESSFATDEPSYAQVCRRLGDYPDLVALIAAHDPDARQPNLLFAAVHYLVLGGIDHPLTEIYRQGGSGDMVPAFVDLVLSNADEINELLATRRTQTNEVGRCALLALMLNDAQRRADQPLAWIDLGASGGLNLNLDRFRIRYDRASGVTGMGPESARLRLHCQVRTGHPPISTDHAEIAWRIGIDRSPIDVNDPAEARWLQACLWPSQPERQARMAAAIDVAHDWPPSVIKADAVEGIAQALHLAPGSAALVITTTWVWYYLPEATQVAVLELLRGSGRRVWWYSLEGRGVVVELGQPPKREVIDSLIGRVEMGGGQTTTAQVLGLAHPHGAWLDWY